PLPFFRSQASSLHFDLVELADGVERQLSDLALARLMQFKEFAARVRHAADFGHALLEAGFVAAVIIADEFPTPGTEEGAGVSTRAPFGKVIDDCLQILEGAGRIGPEVGTVSFLAAGLQNLH